MNYPFTLVRKCFRWRKSLVLNRERREPAAWNAEWQFRLSQACHRADEWCSLSLACLLVMLKSFSGPNQGAPPYLCQRRQVALWCQKMIKARGESPMEKKVMKRQGAWERGLKKVRDMHPHSVSLQFRWAFSLSYLELHWEIQLEMEAALSSLKSNCSQIRGFLLRGCAGRATRRSLAFSFPPTLCIHLDFCFLSSLLPWGLILLVASPAFWYLFGSVA